MNNEIPIDAQTEGFNRSDLRSLIAWLGLIVIVMLLGSLATFSSVSTWFQTLKKPVFNPPDWIFGPVWTTLYLMMAIAAWLVWRKRADQTKRPAVNRFTTVFLVQLSLNLAWSFIFFTFQSPRFALVEICILWVAIAASVILAFRLNKLSGWLLVPYLAWTSFALFLNLAIVRLN